METQNIHPDKITKPIQLLAAWLAGLILVNGSFLTAASQLTVPEWLPPTLVIASIVNVPLFLLSLFLLQTKFRPEMQEDVYYSKYLEKRYQFPPEKKLNRFADEVDLGLTARQLVKKINELPEEKSIVEVESLLKERDVNFIKNEIMGSRTLSQLYLYPEKWNDLVDHWKGSRGFKSDLLELIKSGAVEGGFDDLYKIKLTQLGKDIAKSLEKTGDLWNQKHPGIILE